MLGQDDRPSDNEDREEFYFELFEWSGDVIIKVMIVLAIGIFVSADMLLVCCWKHAYCNTLKFVAEDNSIVDTTSMTKRMKIEIKLKQWKKEWKSGCKERWF